MSLRAFVAVVTVVVLGVLLVVGALTGNYYWTAFVPIAYVIWMFKRDGLPDQGRRPWSHDRWAGYRR